MRGRKSTDTEVKTRLGTKTVKVVDRNVLPLLFIDGEMF